MERFKITEIPRTGGRWGYRNMLAGGLKELMLVVWMRKRNFNKDITAAVIWRNGTTKGLSERNQEQDRQIRVRSGLMRKETSFLINAVFFSCHLTGVVLDFFVSWECGFLCAALLILFQSAALSWCPDRYSFSPSGRHFLSRPSPSLPGIMFKVGEVCACWTPLI